MLFLRDWEPGWSALVGGLPPFSRDCGDSGMAGNAPRSLPPNESCFEGVEGVEEACGGAPAPAPEESPASGAGPAGWSEAFALALASPLSASAAAAGPVSSTTNSHAASTSAFRSTPSPTTLASCAATPATKLSLCCSRGFFCPPSALRPPPTLRAPPARSASAALAAAAAKAGRAAAAESAVPQRARVRVVPSDRAQDGDAPEGGFGGGPRERRAEALLVRAALRLVEDDAGDGELLVEGEGALEHRRGGSRRVRGAVEDEQDGRAEGLGDVRGAAALVPVGAVEQRLPALDDGDVGGVRDARDARQVVLAREHPTVEGVRRAARRRLVQERVEGVGAHLERLHAEAALAKRRHQPDRDRRLPGPGLRPGDDDDLHRAPTTRARAKIKSKSNDAERDPRRARDPRRFPGGGAPSRRRDGDAGVPRRRPVAGVAPRASFSPAEPSGAKGRIRNLREEEIRIFGQLFPRCLPAGARRAAARSLARRGEVPPLATHVIGITCTSSARCLPSLSPSLRARPWPRA